MSTFLLDVNVLIALHSPHHGSYRVVRRWFASHGAENFATCAMTQSGFIRISAQISALENVGMDEAKLALSMLSNHPSHHFWPSEIGYLEAANPLEPRILGPRQITDAYLLGLAIRHRGKLATLDRAILHIAGSEFANHVELIA